MELIHNCGEVVRTFPVGRFLDDTVGEGHAVGSGLLHALRATVTQFLKSGTKLLRHGVVDDGVDGAV